MLKLRAALAAALALVWVGAAAAKPAPSKASTAASPKATMTNLVDSIKKGDKKKFEAQFDWEAMAGTKASDSPAEKASMVSMLKAVFPGVLMNKEFKTLAVKSLKVDGDKAEATTERQDSATKKKVAGPTFRLKKQGSKWLITEMDTPTAASKK